MRLPSINDYTYPSTIEINGFTYDLKNAILSNAFFNKEMTHFFVFFSEFGDKWKNKCVLVMIENDNLKYEVYTLKEKLMKMKELDKEYLGIDYWGSKYNEKLSKLIHRI